MNEPMRLMQWGGLICVHGMLAACATPPPIHYYALQSVAPSAPAAAQASGSALAPSNALVLDPVHIPAELDRLEIVTHGGPYRVRISDEQRWSSPLDDQIRRVLWDDLSQRLPAHTLIDRSTEAEGSSHRRLSVDVLDFFIGPDCRTHLRAAWSIRGPSGHGQQAAGTESIEEAAQDACGVQAAYAPVGMSHALAALADRIADATARSNEN
jgi:hypothetical protein